MIDKKQKAREGELRFAAELTINGHLVFLPYGEDSPIDLLVEKNGKYKRIQVKSTKPNDIIITCRLKSSNNWQVKKYMKKEIDFFTIYDYENRKDYLIPIEKVEGLTEANLRLEKPKNNQERGIRLAKDFEYF